MRLTAIHLNNFRRFNGPVSVPVTDLTALIGRNDIGKSSVLESVGIFLDSPEVELDRDDFCVHMKGTELLIGCSFSELPTDLDIDETVPTSLSAEYLLNAKGELEVYRRWELKDGKPKELGAFARAMHPSLKGLSGLHQLKIAQLKARAKELVVDIDEVDKRTSSELRRAIWGSKGPVNLEIVDVPLNQEGTKAIWGKIKESLPGFALFRADRPSTDQDGEVQEPMKYAVKLALAQIAPELARVKEAVQTKALEVAERTLETLHELDESLSESLSPEFTEEPKWAGVFKLSLRSANQIPLNKRGSGFRRLVLLSFFRAVAERQKELKQSQSLIYAIEEPEASQHPANQKMLVEALKDLSDVPGCQVLLTTHVPALAEVIATDSLRHIYPGPNETLIVDSSGDAMIKSIADNLGVIPDKRAKVIVWVSPAFVDTLLS